MPVQHEAKSSFPFFSIFYQMDIWRIDEGDFSTIHVMLLIFNCRTRFKALWWFLPPALNMWKRLLNMQMLFVPWSVNVFLQACTCLYTYMYVCTHCIRYSYFGTAFLLINLQVLGAEQVHSRRHYIADPQLIRLSLESLQSIWFSVQFWLSSRVQYVMPLFGPVMAEIKARKPLKAAAAVLAPPFLPPPPTSAHVVLIIAGFEFHASLNQNMVMIIEPVFL